MSTPPRLVVVRHGRTGWNAEGRFQGQADPPLDRVGHRQAEAVADAVAALRPGLILASDLRRARQTAQPLGARCGLPVIPDARLREVDLGGWAGLDRAEAARRYPDEYDRWSRGIDVRRGGGETLAEAGTRAAAALLAALTGTAPGSTVVAVSHGLVLRAAISRLAGLGIVRLAVDAPHLANGEWNCVPLVSTDVTPTATGRRRR
ncbi:histidine phosphatase family protein [Planosporangium thailandense]|uniref:Histidine phosphatase family protein n=1 Tax=Planosporangium thailandense TaxID=765197 RepID=A0ABX0XZ13_9ACTN|nr:histidine phosphatase family protein [Planosporangium thailandense]NJC71137.1 histidine phosphatase family protein [Planosporangium thailandense]